MPSRLLIGASAWLLGAVTATAGSLYAVDQLGQGLIAQHSKRVSVAMVNRELAQENSERPLLARTPSPRASASPSPSPSPAASRSRGPRAAGTAPRPSSHRPRPSSTARVLNTVGGQAEAACQQGSAQLVYESPSQGYDIHDLQPGPAAQASVTFTSSGGGVVLKVTCSSSDKPVEHVSSFTWSDDSHHDD